MGYCSLIPSHLTREPLRFRKPGYLEPDRIFTFAPDSTGWGPQKTEGVILGMTIGTEINDVGIHVTEFGNHAVSVSVSPIPSTVLTWRATVSHTF